MSRPVYEPSLPRADAALAWGSRQLFRRPSPVSGAGMEPTIILGGGGTIAPHDTWMPIPFENLAYDPVLVTQGVIFDWVITDSGDAGNDRYEITTQTEGWYEVELITFWDESATGGTEEFGAAIQRITFDSVIGFSFDPTDYRSSADWMDADLHPFFEMKDCPWLHDVWRIYVPANRDWLPTAKQNTGVDRGLSGLHMRISFLGVDETANWTYESV